MTTPNEMPDYQIGDMATLGITLNEFYNAMRVSGFDEPKAFALTLEFMRSMFANARDA